jgi:hypothetical protein
MRFFFNFGDFFFETKCVKIGRTKTKKEKQYIRVKNTPDDAPQV